MMALAASVIVQNEWRIAIHAENDQPNIFIVEETGISMGVREPETPR
jgi:hypothetical protein